LRNRSAIAGLLCVWVYAGKIGPVAVLEVV
jgi:hypothetical protein